MAKKIDQICIPAVHFTTFCKEATLEEIKHALLFYTDEFIVDKIPEYFSGWTIVNDDSKYKNGKILTNHHAKNNWDTPIHVNDNSEYCIDAIENRPQWQYLPKTWADFISDMLRYQDIYLVLTEKGRRVIYRDQLVHEEIVSDQKPTFIVGLTKLQDRKSKLPDGIYTATQCAYIIEIMNYKSQVIETVDTELGIRGCCSLVIQIKNGNIWFKKSNKTRTKWPKIRK